MTDAWFSTGAAMYFSAAGLLSLTALAAPFIAKGKHRTAILTLWVSIIAAGLSVLMAGVIAVIVHQPYHVTVPLLVTGIAMVSGYSVSTFFVVRAYRMAERRKVAAREL